MFRRTSPIANLQREPTMGIEPITYNLQGGCSAILSYVGALQLLKNRLQNVLDYTKPWRLKQGLVICSEGGVYQIS